MKPLKISDPKTKKSILAPVASSQLCPVNLLGRDLMMKLGIAVGPNKNDLGMKAGHINLKITDSDDEDETGTFVREGLTLN